MGVVHPGKLNPNWKGGRSIASNGYVLVKRHGHHLADSRGYVYEHRLAAEEKIGRPLRTGELVHHVNGIKTDNRPENLEVVESIARHWEEHGLLNPRRRKQGQRNPRVLCACGCKTGFSRFDEDGRPRRFVTGHNVAKGRIYL